MRNELGQRVGKQSDDKSVKCRRECQLEERPNIFRNWHNFGDHTQTSPGLDQDRVPRASSPKVADLRSGIPETLCKETTFLTWFQCIKLAVEPDHESQLSSLVPNLPLVLHPRNDPLLGDEWVDMYHSDHSFIVASDNATHKEWIG